MKTRENKSKINRLHLFLAPHEKVSTWEGRKSSFAFAGFNFAFAFGLFGFKCVFCIQLDFFRNIFLKKQIKIIKIFMCLFCRQKVSFGTAWSTKISYVQQIGTCGVEAVKLLTWWPYWTVPCSSSLEWQVHRTVPYRGRWNSRCCCHRSVQVSLQSFADAAPGPRLTPRPQSQ